MNDHSASQHPDQEAEIIAEYLSRLRALKPKWERNFLLLFFPGILLFVIGGPGGLLLPGGTPNHNLWLIIPGIILCVIGGFRGVRLMLKYRRCPVCDRFQDPSFQFPYRSCVRCGSKLSNDWRETR